MMNYNSLQITGRRRFNHGFEFLTNYTWSKGLTNNLGYYGGTGSSQSAYWQDAYNGRETTARPSLTQPISSPLPDTTTFPSVVVASSVEI